MHNTDRAGLRAFAGDLAHRLPGEWTSDYLVHAKYPDQFRRAASLWDLAVANPSVVNYAVDRYILEHDAILTGPDGVHLYVIDRPLRTDQFLIAPFVPVEIDDMHLRHVQAPSAIALPRDPARAASLVVRRLLPDYQQAIVEARGIGQAPPAPLVVPPRLKDRVAMAWQDDGSLVATACDQHAETDLFLAGFQYDPYERAFILEGGNAAGQARCVQAAAQLLSRRNVSVVVHRAKSPTPSSAPTPPAAPPRPAPRAASRH
ncbi:hypothetical protein ACWGCC_03800 [Streptomyces nigrescens]